MNIIFNHDGSIKNLNLNEIIVQGNNLVNEIQIAIEGRTPDDYVATAYFTLPDGTSNYLTGSADNFSIDQTPYSGYSINLTSAQTAMAGEVGMTIQCTDANSHVLCTYKVKLTINESSYEADGSTITAAQLAALNATLATFQEKYVAPNVRSYPSLEDAEEDLENLADKQIIVIGDTEDDTPSTPLDFYYKYNDALVPFDFGYGFIELDVGEVSGYLTDFQTAQAKKSVCFIKRGSVIYYAQESYSDGATRYFYAIPLWATGADYVAKFIEVGFYDNQTTWDYGDTKVHTDSTPTDGSLNLVTSNGVYDAIATAKSTIEGEISTAIEGVESEISSLTRTLIHKDDYSTLSTSFDAYGVAPKALPKASLDGFLGNSVVRNQLVQNGDFASSSGWTAESGVTLSVSSNVATIVSTTAGNGINRSISILSGRKYLISFTAKSSDSLTIKIGGSYDTGTQKSQSLTSSFVTYSAVVTASGNGNSFYIFATATGTFDIKQVQLIDLTQWFGSNDLIPADLISTPSLFLSKYAYGMDLSFNTGTLVDGTLTKLKANPFNVWDEEWELGAYNGSTGAKVSSSTEIRSKNKIRVISGQTYHFAVVGRAATYPSSNVAIFAYKANGDYIGIITANSSGNFDIPIDCTDITFYVAGNYGTTYKNDICINVSNASMNGTYLPHANPIETPLSIGTMRSAGSVRDTNELTKVGRINMGDLTYTHVAGNVIFKAQLPLGKYGLNLLCSKFIAVSSTPTAGGQMYFYNEYYGDHYIAFRTTEQYESPSAFQTAMNGVYLNYELTTPTARTTTFPEIIDIHSGGVIEAEFTDLPVTTQITYLEEE